MSRLPSVVPRDWRAWSTSGNNNTTCTIKSAPPRTPEGMLPLSIKSGWMVKRNEQHVWQRRWCCVVPHTFLYYFDACPEASTGGGAPPPVVQDQDELNNAVIKDFFQHKKPSGPRSSLYFYNNPIGGPTSTPTSKDVNTSFHGETPDNKMMDEDSSPAIISNTNNTQPVGIIDLECYTEINRGSANTHLMELTGEGEDLRSFFFLADSLQDVDDWTTSLLRGRYSTLREEKDAYEEVVDEFTAMLQKYSQDLHAAEEREEEAREELYRVRSSLEEDRRLACDKLREFLQYAPTSPYPSNGSKHLEKSRRAYLAQLHSKELIPAITLIGDYLQSVVWKEYQKLEEENEELRQKAQNDESLAKLKEELDSLQLEQEESEKKHTEEKQALQAQIQKQRELLHSTKQELESVRMEFGMHQQTVKTKWKDLQHHKRVLKEEVIRLRQRVDEIGGDNHMLQHQSESLKRELGRERQEKEELEKFYVQHMQQQRSLAIDPLSTTPSSTKSSNHYAVASPQNNGSGGGSLTTHRATQNNSHYAVASQQNETEDSAPAQTANNEIEHDYSGVVEKASKTTEAPKASPSRKSSRNTRLAAYRKKVEQRRARSSASICSTPDNAEHPIAVTSESPQAQPQIQTVQLETPRMKHTRQQKQEIISPSNNSRNTMEAEESEIETHQDSEYDIRQGRSVLQEDEKSHVSELTEDRTQRQFDFFQSQHQQQQQQQPERQERESTNNVPPVIINSGGPHLPPAPAPRFPTPKRHRSAIKRQDSELQSVSSIGSIVSASNPYLNGGNPPGRKLSVAQRARMEADSRSSTPLRIKRNSSENLASMGRSQAVSPTPSSDSSFFQTRRSTRNNGPQKQRPPPRGASGASVASTQDSFFANLGRTLESAIDKSVLGIRINTSDDESSSDPMQRQLEDEVDTPLARRKQLQREKQLKFLKERGLIDDEKSLKGGAGASSPTASYRSVS